MSDQNTGNTVPPAGGDAPNSSEPPAPNRIEHPVGGAETQAQEQPETVLEQAGSQNVGAEDLQQAPPPPSPFGTPSVEQVIGAPVQPSEQPMAQPAATQQPFGVQPQPEQPAYRAPAMPQGYTQQIPQPAAPQPYGQPHNAGAYQQPPAYGHPCQPPLHPYGGNAYQPPQQPYPPYGAYGQQQPPKKKVWPWVLVGCLLIGLLGLGGCVGCVACTAVMADSGCSNSYCDPHDEYGYNYEHGYNYEYDNGRDGSPSPFTYSYSEITADKSSYDNVIENGRISNGIYEVGIDFAAGRYFFEGDPILEGRYIVYEPTGSGSSEYEIEESVVYFGNYYADLEAGDIVVFSPAANEHAMTASADASFSPVAPYRGGLYLVGADIPAGAYTVEYDENAAANATMESAAYIMKDLEWDDDSVTDEFYAVKGTRHTITVTEGQWLEAYAVVLTPADAS